MEKLVAEATKSTPSVELDAENYRLSLKGQSYPENAFKFYEPIFQWVDDFIAQAHADKEVRIDFSLSYINTSSSKCMMMLLEKLDEAFLDGKKVSLYWHYNVGNESELECAEEFKEDLNLPFHIVPIEE